MHDYGNVCMLADYIENGIDRYNAFIAAGALSFDGAVAAVVEKLEQAGAKIKCVTVIFGQYSLDQLMDMAVAPAQPGTVAMQYLFE